ncbi:MAG: hypothetical protein ABII06_04680 [Pseudomonadota bacterium]
MKMKPDKIRDISFTTPGPHFPDAVRAIASCTFNGNELRGLRVCHGRWGMFVDLPRRTFGDIILSPTAEAGIKYHVGMEYRRLIAEQALAQGPSAKVKKGGIK